MKNKLSILILTAALILFGIIMRLIDHPANFAPIAAIALFAGVYLPKKYALILPPAIMFISDIFLGFYAWQVMAAVYGSFFLAGIIGLYLRNHKSLGGVISASLGASILFFFITNLAVFFFSGLYELSWQGFLTCYTLAIPFFRNTMLGDLFFVGVLFGSYELAWMWVEERAKTTANIKIL